MMPIRMVFFFLVLVLLTVAAFVIAFKTAKPARARDLGQWSQVNPEQRNFFNGLKDNTGFPCCSDADGFEVQKSEGRGAALWVQVEGGWFEVPASSMLRRRNPYGSARAWIGLKPDGSKFVRCYIDGYGG